MISYNLIEVKESRVNALDPATIVPIISRIKNLDTAQFPELNAGEPSDYDQTSPSGDENRRP